MEKQQRSLRFSYSDFNIFSEPKILQINLSKIQYMKLRMKTRDEANSKLEIKTR